MKRKILLAALIVSTPTAFAAQDDTQDPWDGFYATGAFGINYGDTVSGSNNIKDFTDYGNDYGESYQLGLGFRFDENFRIEGRVSHRNNDSDNTRMGFSPLAGMDVTGTVNGKLSSTSVTVDGFYDFANQTSFTPYLKAGVGVARNSYEATLFVSEFNAGFGYEEETSTEFVWNVGAGVSYELTKTVDLFAEYQLQSLGEVKTATDISGDAIGNDDYLVQEVNIGLRYLF
ncbi:porin family protein [Photobacterium sagamiensis]|uniref:outer membrane protein n=1 Tax=Photobacterium sagamiensis TaxID=2910241 RepID=UPI003D0B6657